MPLSEAHKGYEYQDLITAYFIIEEIIDDYNSSFKIDKKEFKKDKFDDLTIIIGQEVLKKQIKYSDSHILKKQDLSAKGTYELAIDLLYNSWLSNPEKEKIKDIRLCLAWGEPIDDELIKVLIIADTNKSFKNYKTSQYKINVDKLWKNNKPLNSWKRLGVESKNIDKQLFIEFCKNLVIEVEFPKFSLDFDKPNDLEVLILRQVEQLGIGVYHLYNYD